MGKAPLISGILASVLAFSVAQASEVNLYSHRHYDTDKELYKLFEKKTGIKVNVIQAKADELIKRLEVEGKDSKADAFITADAGNLHRAKALGLLQKVDSKTINSIVPAHLRDEGGEWFGLTKRARIIAYAKDRVDPKKITSYEDLTKPEWKGKVLVRSSGNIYNQSLLSSMIETQGADKAQAWAKGIVENMARAPKGNDRDQVKAVFAKEGDVAILNTYYLGIMLNSPKEEDRAVAQSVGIIFPNQNDRGTHINISGIGVTKAAKNYANAVKLIEFLLSQEAQSLFAEANYEYPINPKVKASGTVASWGEFKEDSVSLNALGKNNAEAIKIFDQVGWR